MKISLRSLRVAAALLLAHLIAGVSLASPQVSQESAPSPAGWDDEVGIVRDEFSVARPSETLSSQSMPQRSVSDVVGTGLVLSEGEDSSEYLPTSVGSDFLTAYDRGAGLIGGGEILLTKVFGSLGQPDFGFKPAYRVWLGYQSENGLGGRLRYWSYDQSDVFQGLWTYSDKFHTFDAELTQQVDYYSWNFLVSGGVRQAESRLEELVGPPPGNGNYIGFSGAGLTFSGTATRDLTSSGSLRFLAAARWSTLFGNTRVGVIDSTNYPVANTTLNILELSAGPQYVRELDNGALLTLFGGAEAQTWDKAYGVSAQDISFLGFSASVSILR